MSSTSSERATPGLRRGAVGWAGALGQSVAVLCLPLAATAAATAAVFAGAATPLAFVLAGCGCLCLASVMARLSARFASAGGVYTLIARGLGPGGGFIGGWLYGAAFAASISIVLCIGGASMSSLLSRRLDWHVGWLACFLVLMAALVALAFLDVRLSTRTQLAVAVFSAAAILLLALIVVLRGGATGVTLAPFDPTRLPSSEAFFPAVVFAFSACFGFEAAAALGEEVVAPRRTIPRVILGAAVVVVIWSVFTSWTLAIGFGVDDSAAWAGDVAPLDALAARYAGDWLPILVDVAVILATFVAALGLVHVAAQTLYAMAREGGLPRAVAWTHPTHRRPWVAIGLTLTATVLLILILGRRWETADAGPFPYVQFMALAVALAILTSYVLVASSGVACSLRERGRFSIAMDLLAPAGAVAICAYATYRSVHPLPPAPAAYAVWVVLGWLVLGLVVLGALTVTRPARVRAFGSILGDGGSPPDGAEPSATRGNLGPV